MKKVLIITYYWPPSGGAGVQRMLKLVKYIREFGWEPIVFTADGAEYPIHDESLLKDIPKGVEIWKQKIWEPYDLYKRLIGQKKEEKVYSGFVNEKGKAGAAQKLSVWIRGNFFIPDARKFWIKPAVKFLSEKLKHTKVDAIISSGPPHTCHLIALGVKQKIALPWLADFRDPWTQIDFYEQLHLSKMADAKHKRLEKKVLANADAVDTVSWSWANGLKEIGKRNVKVITNGFDEADFTNTKVEADKRFSVVHVGSINPDRNHNAFWKALQQLCEANADFKNDLVIRLIGKNDHAVYNSIQQHQLQNNLESIDYLPHHDVAAQQMKAALLLLPLNNTPNVKGIIPGKIFEYLAAHRPVFVIGDTTGDSAKIITEAQAGTVCHFTDTEKMKTDLLHYYQQWKQGTLTLSNNNINQYTRRNIAKQIAGVLNQICNAQS